MLQSESEYQDTLQLFREENSRLMENRRRLEEMGMSDVEIKNALDPLESLVAQLSEEIADYERAKRGEIGVSVNLHGIGIMLVALRIALGMSQRDLSERLGVEESWIVREERNEYRGVSVSRILKMLDILGVLLSSHVDSLRG